MGLIATVGKDNGPLRLFTGDEVFAVAAVHYHRPTKIFDQRCLWQHRRVLPQYVQGHGPRLGQTHNRVVKRCRKE